MFLAHCENYNGYFLILNGEKFWLIDGNAVVNKTSEIQP